MKRIIVLTDNFLRHSVFYFFYHIVFIGFSFITKKSLIEKCVLIFCYTFFSQKTANNGSFVFSNLSSNGLCLTTKKKWRHCGANSTCIKVFLTDIFETTYDWKYPLQNHFTYCCIILNRSSVVDEYVYLFSTQIHVR